MFDAEYFDPKLEAGAKQLVSMEQTLICYYKSQKLSISASL